MIGSLLLIEYLILEPIKRRLRHGGFKTMERLSVENVSFLLAFQEILKDINFTLKKGKVVSIVGQVVGGKTTLLHLCAKLLTT